MPSVTSRGMLSYHPGPLGVRHNPANRHKPQLRAKPSVEERPHDRPAEGPTTPLLAVGSMSGAPTKSGDPAPVAAAGVTMLSISVGRGWALAEHVAATGRRTWR